eukprot:scaffold976_cov214-Ochromonas_danica.AAC.11
MIQGEGEGEERLSHLNDNEVVSTRTITDMPCSDYTMNPIIVDQPRQNNNNEEEVEQHDDEDERVGMRGKATSRVDHDDDDDDEVVVEEEKGGAINDNEVVKEVVITLDKSTIAVIVDQPK